MPMCLCYNIYDAVLYFQESEMISSLWKQHNISLSWAFLIAQLVKNLPAMQETPVREDHWRRDTLPTTVFLGFSCGSAGIESACNAGDLGWIPGLGRSPGEGKGYPLQYSQASLRAQRVNNLPAMWETWVWPLGWEDLLEKGKATHCNILAWRISWTTQSMRSQSVGQDWVTFTFTLD